MKTIKSIVLIILCCLLTACNLTILNDKTTIITEPQADFYAYKELLLKKLKSSGAKEFKYRLNAGQGYSEFIVDYKNRNDLSIAFSVLEDGYSIFCYPSSQPQSLPLDFDLNIIVALLHSLDEKAISFETLSSFFLAADNEYLPDDYEFEMSLPFPGFDITERILSYKYLVVGDCYLKLWVGDKGNSKLWLYSYKKLPQQDTVHYANSIKGVLEYYKCNNWIYCLAESFFTDLSDGSRLYISLSSKAKNSLLFNPVDLTFDLTVTKQLAKVEDSFTTIDFDLLAELCSVLQADISLSSQLQDFLYDTTGLYDYPATHGWELLVRFKTLTVNGKNINFNYLLEPSLVETFSIELTNE